MRAAARSFAHRAEVVKHADLRTRPIVHNKEGTVYGGIETICIILFMLFLVILFLVQLFTESITISDTPTSEGQINVVNFVCVSHSGCNVTYNFDMRGACSSLADVPPAFYKENDTMALPLCWEPGRFDAGIVIRAAIDITVQWQDPRNKFHIAELVQNGKTPIPLVPLINQRAQIVRFERRTDKTATGFWDAFSFRDNSKIISSQWDLTAPGNAAPDDACRDVTYPIICGSMIVQPTEFFIERTNRLSNNLRADLISPLLSITAGLLFLSSIIAKHCCKDGIYIGDDSSDEEMTSL